MLVPRRNILSFGLIASATIARPPPAAADGAASPQPGDALVAADDPTRSPLHAAAIGLGNLPVLAWPMQSATGTVRDGSRLNQVLLLRVRAGSQEPDGKLVAFSAICTHAACLISGWLPQPGRLQCPCHDSQFDPARGGAVTAGPAPLPLPSLPVQVLDGLIEVAGHFSIPPGGHTGRTM